LLKTTFSTPLCCHTWCYKYTYMTCIPPKIRVVIERIPITKTIWFSTSIFFYPIIHFIHLFLFYLLYHILYYNATISIKLSFIYPYLWIDYRLLSFELCLVMYFIRIKENHYNLIQFNNNLIFPINKLY